MLDFDTVEAEKSKGIFAWLEKIPWVKIGGVMLAIFSMSRTVDLVGAFLPPEQKIFSFAGVAAFDLGFLFWLWHYSGSARGQTQKMIASVMVIVDFFGMMIFLGADVVYRSAQAGTIPPLPSTFGYFAIAVLVLAFMFNVGGFAADSLSSPRTRRRMAEQNAFDRVADRAIDKVNEESEYLANEIAPDVAAHWVGHMRTRFNHALRMPQVIEGQYSNELPSQRKTIRKPKTVRDKIAKFFDKSEEEPTHVVSNNGHSEDTNFTNR